MPDTIPLFWPENLRVDVQTPYAILRVQAGALARLTRGVLDGVVETDTSGDNVQHRLVIVARAQNGYRHTLLTAIHKRNLPYPVEVREESLGKQELVFDREQYTSIDEYETVYPSASSDEQMHELLQKALRSDSTVAIISSLIANSNEANAVASS